MNVLDQTSEFHSFLGKKHLSSDTDYSSDNQSLIKLQAAIADLNALIQYFPHGPCELSTNNSNNKKNGSLIDLWSSMETTICGLHSKRILNTDENYKSTVLMLNLMSMNPIILYAPNNTLVRSLISQINSTFDMIDKINAYTNDWLQNSIFLKDLIKKTDARILASRNSTLDNDDSQLVTRCSNDTIQDIDLIDNAACSWLRLTSSINLDIFKGFQSEDELVTYFLNDAFNSNQTVISSIVFANVYMNSTELPKLVKYKIRQNASLTLNTKRVRDRYWFPSTTTDTYFYYIFGFVWLQDLIDRSIIDYQLNKTVYEPGTFVSLLNYLNLNFFLFSWNIY